MKRPNEMDTESKEVITIAAVGDLHACKEDAGRYADLFSRVGGKADLLLLAGDLTHTGDESEATLLLESMSRCSIPILCVLGNHDYEKGREKKIRECLLQHPGLYVLDGESVIIKGVGFAGIKGFGGGFDNHMLAMFGEKEMKDFVEVAVMESLKLERALARLDKEQPDIKKVALMHYAPCSQTIQGEPEAIYPFLGSSRLAEPLMRQNVEVAFHGHAHAGLLKGQISGVPIYNVAKDVLEKKDNADGFFLYKLKV